MCKKLFYVIPFVSLLYLISSVANAGALVGHWKLDETSGTTARDSSGNNFHGTVTGTPQWVVGQINGALQLNGTTDYVTTPNIGLNSNTVTITAWVKRSGDQTGWAGIAFCRTGAACGLGFSGQAINQIQYHWNDAASTYNFVSGLTVPDNVWAFVALVIEPSKGTLYLNGSANSATNSVSNTAGPLGVISIGQDPTGGRFVKGLIDDVRIYSRSLTAVQIQDLFNGIAPTWPKAEVPIPANGATGVTTPLVQWTAGEGASFHDVYFGTNPTPGPAEYKGRQGWNMYWHGPGIIPGTVYYWRVDEVQADGVTMHTGDVWSFTAAPLTAYNPNPRDGAKWVDTEADVSWSAGAGGIWYDVYFGTDQAAVANGTGGTLKTSKQTATSYDPGTLTKDTTYYWRIDEYDSGGTKHAGDVWRFRTLPEIPITDPTLVGWWKLDEDSGTSTIDWSGHNNHGALRGNPQRVAGYGGNALAFDGVDDYVEVPHAASLTVSSEVTVMAWINTSRYMGGPTGGNDWQAILAKSNDPRSYSFYTYTDGTLHFSTTSGGAYVGSNSTGIVPLSEWVHVAAMVVGGRHRYYINGEPAGEGGGGIVLPGATDTASVMIAVSHEGSNGFLGMIDDVRIYNVGLTQAQIKEAMRGDPTLAWNPKPANGAITDIDRAVPLTWSPGEKAAQHDVYFGTDQTAVDSATTASTGIYRGRQAAANFTPAEGLQWGGGPYYWRIDEYNTDGTVSTGRLWSFTIADYLIVDDFEGYTDDVGSRIFQTWKDGWGYSEPPPGYAGNGTGSTVGKDQAPFAEQNTTHGGSQSMPLGYDNSGTGGKARYSETFREWASPQDWTRYNIKALTLYFYGALDNAAEQLYVALEDNAAHVKVVNHPDIEAVQKAGWQEWNIELTQFSAAGVNLKAIKKMYIGLGNRSSPKLGGTGTIFIDDMRLYPSRCIASIAKPAADLSGNCVVDAADVDILANLWLDTGFQVTPVDPGTTGLIARYPFEGNANDVVGGHNGTTVGMPTYAAGKIGQAIQLNGVDQMVDVGAVGVSGAGQRTIAGWAKANALIDALPNWINIFGFTGPSGNYLHFDIEVVEALGVRGYGIHVYGWERRIMPIDFEWHHLAASYDGTTTKYYGDGRLIGSDSTLVLNTPDNVHIGKRDDNDNYWPGRVDEVRIYSRVLTDAQIASLAGHTSVLSIPADLRQDNVINFKDFAVLADSWLEQLLWP